MINELNSEEIPEALNLVWDVFKKYESPDYSPEGTEEFRKCLHDSEYLKSITYFGECPTMVSMVFDVTEMTVYWCEKRRWDSIHEVLL